MQTQSYERINIILPKDTVKRLRKAVPKGQRSKVISAAINDKLNTLSGKNAYRELLRIRKKGPKVSLEEIVGWIREDRRSH